MKKRWTGLTALLLILMLISTAFAGNNQPAAEGWVLDGLNGCIWMDDRASAEISLEDRNYQVLISWGDSAWTAVEWVYTCDYDPQTQLLLARHVVCDTVTYGGKGVVTKRENQFEKESAAVFFMNGRNELTILNAGDDRLEQKTFSPFTPGQEQTGEWTITDSAELTEEARKVFDSAMKNLVGAAYDPVALLGEYEGVYCILCRVTVIYPDAKPQYALVYVAEDGIRNVWTLWIDAHAGE